MVEFLQFTLSGLSFGMIYAAIALSHWPGATSRFATSRR